jgi:hypothetical protein
MAGASCTLELSDQLPIVCFVNGTWHIQRIATSCFLHTKMILTMPRIQRLHKHTQRTVAAGMRPRRN